MERGFKLKTLETVDTLEALHSRQTERAEEGLVGDDVHVFNVVVELEGDDVSEPLSNSV